jgi:hypothetical protein
MNTSSSSSNSQKSLPGNVGILGDEPDAHDLLLVTLQNVASQDAFTEIGKPSRRGGSSSASKLIRAAGFSCVDDPRRLR